MDKNVKHVIPCCDNGWIELPTLPAPTVATDNSGETEQEELWREVEMLIETYTKPVLELKTRFLLIRK